MKTTAVMFFLLLFVVYSIAVKTELRREKSPVTAFKIGQPMPDFELMDTNNKPVKFSEAAKGKKVVVVNFWASWCGPCRVEMPGFEKLYREEKDDGFTILAITEDKDRAKLDKYLKEKPVTFPVLIDKDNALAEKFKIESLPTTIVIKEDGKIQRVEEGVSPYLEYSVRASLKIQKK